MFKVKFKIGSQKEGKYVGRKFKGKRNNNESRHIFTLTSYNPIKKIYLRNDGEGTPESPYFKYSEEDIEANLIKYWVFVN